MTIFNFQKCGRLREAQTYLSASGTQYIGYLRHCISADIIKHIYMMIIMISVLLQPDMKESYRLKNYFIYWYQLSTKQGHIHTCSLITMTTGVTMAILTSRNKL